MSEATMRLPKFTSLEDVTKHFVELPAVREQLEARTKEVERQRRDQVKALASVRKRREDCGALSTAFERAQAVEREAERALEHARTARLAALNAICSHTDECDLTIRKLEWDLRETADPAIGEFIEWALAAMWDERKNGRVGSVQSNGRDPVTGKERAATAYSNTDSHERRLAAINAAIAAAEALRFGAEADVTEKIAALRASIPARDLSTRKIGTIAPEYLEHGEPDDDRKPTLVERLSAERAGAAGSGR